MKMQDVRCRNAHPRLKGKPCNEMVRIGAVDTCTWVECERCRGMIRINFDEMGVATVVEERARVVESRARFVDKGLMRV